MNTDAEYLDALRPLPKEQRYAKLKELVPSSYTIGDISKTMKRLAAQGVEVPWS